MRIIDKRKDYYDGVVLYSDTPVWVRKESSFIVEKENPFGLSNDIIEHISRPLRHACSPGWRRHTSADMMNKFSCRVVALCGKLYMVYLKDTYLGRPKDVISASTPSLFVKKWNNDENDKDRYIKLEDRGVPRWYNRHSFNDKGHDSWMFANHELPCLAELHRTFKSPIFTLNWKKGEIELTINPILSNIGFQVVKDPWFMFQELERYIGNDLVDVPLDTFKMSDELKRDSKGMDNWSFKQKGPKARKRKR